MPETPRAQLDLTLPAGLLLLILAVVGAAVGFRAWVGLNDREPLLSGLPAGGAHQREVPPPRQVRRAVLIIADGLTAELALTLDPIQKLQAKGILAESEAASPTFSRASYVTWLAGVDPVDSGVRTNRYRTPLPLDSVLSRTRAGKLRSLGYDEHDSKLSDLFGPHLTLRRAGVESWPQVMKDLQEIDLAVLALTSPDKAGHRHGSASSEYQQAAAGVARQIAEVAAALDLSQDLLIVLNDHGHLPGGGHGGMEPVVRRLFLVAAGAGLTPGRKGRIDQKDLAPTLAHLLGLLPPAHNRGWSLGWALDPQLDPFFFEAAFASQYPARHRVDHYLAEQLHAPRAAGRGYPRPEDLVRATLGSLAEARRLGWHLLQALQQRADRARLDRLHDLRVRRGIWASVFLLLGLALIVAAGRLKLLRVGFLGAVLAVLALAAIAAVLFLLDVKVSLSLPGERLHFFLRVAGAGAAGAVLHLLLAFVLPGRAPGLSPRATPVGRLLAGAWLLSAVAMAGFTLVPVGPGSALAQPRLLAGALLAWICWVAYLVPAGLVLTLAGLRRAPTAS